jgi:hypothetical protein
VFLAIAALAGQNPKLFQDEEGLLAAYTGIDGIWGCGIWLVISISRAKVTLFLFFSWWWWCSWWWLSSVLLAKFQLLLQLLLFILVLVVVVVVGAVVQQQIIGLQEQIDPINLLSWSYPQ